MKPLLIEIGVEELPALSLTKELKNIEKKYKECLNSYGFDEPFRFEFTPRRFVFLHPNFPTSQPDSKEELFGPPVEAAYKDDKPTPAAIGFAKKCGVEIGDLKEADQKGRKVLYFEKQIRGRELQEVVGEMIESFLKTLNLGKIMRWEMGGFEFTRPVRNLVVMHADQVIKCEVFGISSSNKTLVHRMDSYEPQPIGTIDCYESLLEANGVILSSKKRREKILNEIAELEKKHNILVEKDNDLLDEVVAITEYPTALIGSFDQHFLELPKEVVITSMKSHQRYFPVFANDTLTNRFLVVSNARCDDFALVISGNEKVLRPRLSDALFFYENDIKNGLDSEPLENVIFVRELGTMWDKVQREVEIAKILLDFYSQSDQHLIRAAELSKADLSSEMVYEFTELQGVMGRYYALAQGEPAEVADAIYEQYLPLGENSPLPATNTGRLLSIATKLDALMGLFSIGHIPTGSKDPLALRRAAAGFARIVIDSGFSTPLDRLFAKLAHLYKEFDYQLLIGFIFERFTNHLDINSSIIKAVIATGEKDLLRIYQKSQAVEQVSQKEGFKDDFATFKRVANILKDTDRNTLAEPDQSLFEEDAEKRLFEAFVRIEESDFEALLEKLFQLKPLLDSYFDQVMVNVENEKLKTNRLSTINAIYQEFKKVADIKEISF